MNTFLVSYILGLSVTFFYSIFLFVSIRGKSKRNDGLQVSLGGDSFYNGKIGNRPIAFGWQALFSPELTFQKNPVPAIGEEYFADETPAQYSTREYLMILFFNAVVVAISVFSFSSIQEFIYEIEHVIRYSLFLETAPLASTFSAIRIAFFYLAFATFYGMLGTVIQIPTRSEKFNTVKTSVKYMLDLFYLITMIRLLVLYLSFAEIFLFILCFILVNGLYAALYFLLMSVVFKMKKNSQEEQRRINSILTVKKYIRLTFIHSELSQGTSAGELFSKNKLVAMIRSNLVNKGDGDYSDSGVSEEIISQVLEATKDFKAEHIYLKEAKVYRINIYSYMLESASDSEVVIKIKHSEDSPDWERRILFLFDFDKNNSATFVPAWYQNGVVSPFVKYDFIIGNTEQ